MEATSDSDDGSNTFWPGYVDAVTNLAINLLFVIAVMSLVVLVTTMQVSDLMKRKALAEGSQLKIIDSESSGLSLDQLKEKLQSAQANLQRTQAKLVEAEKKIKQKENLVKNELPIELVSVASPPQTESAGGNDISTFGSGVMVHFSTDAVTMGANEISDLVVKLNKLSPVESTRWQVLVISPKGFSEALRLSYYRANAVRNALIENGAPASAIELKILESSQASANNAKVLVKVQP